MFNFVPERLRSRKFIAAISTGLVGIINALGVIDLDGEKIVPIIIVVVSYILGQSFVDAAKAKNGE